MITRLQVMLSELDSKSNIIESKLSEKIEEGCTSVRAYRGEEREDLKKGLMKICNKSEIIENAIIELQELGEC